MNNKKRSAFSGQRSDCSAVVAALDERRVITFSPTTAVTDRRYRVAFVVSLLATTLCAPALFAAALETSVVDSGGGPAASAKYALVDSVGDIDSSAGAAAYRVYNGFIGQIAGVAPAAGPTLAVSPGSQSFGTVLTGTSSNLAFQVSNAGSGTLTGTAVVQNAGSPFAIAAGSPFSLSAGNSTNVVVSFSPGSAGSFSNKVVFASDGGVSTNPVTGAAIMPGHLLVTPGSYNFGTIATGAMAQTSFVVSNTGGMALTGNAAVSLPFAIMSGSPFSLAGSGSTNVVVSFMPTNAATFNADVIFTSDTAGSSTNPVTGTGAIAPAAKFTASATSGAAPLLVNFTDASTGTITNRLWSFGDTGTSTLASPSHTYTTAGVFSVALTVSGPLGLSTSNALITVTNVVPQPPVAGFTADPTTGAAALLVAFTNTSTGAITNQFWIFGDGATSSLLNPSHQYTTAGVYSVSLTVFGPGGSNTLNRPNLITVTNDVAPPVPWFTANPTLGAAPLLVVFTDASTGGTITNYLWTFGDGATSGGTTPTHTYTNAGVFSVSLTVSGPGGSDTTNRANLITVTNVTPRANFSADVTSGPAPLTVNFTDASTGTITNRLWNFGDGDTSSALNPPHTYTTAGVFSASLTVSGPTGSDTTNALITVTSPAADLQLFKQASPSPVAVESNLTYAITVTNRGPGTATSITVTDALPASVSFVLASDECTNDAGQVVCDLGSLTSGKATNVTIVVVPTLAGWLTNSASVAAAETDPNPTNNTATAVTQVFTNQPPQGNLAVVKLKAPKKITVKTNVTSIAGKFSVTIQNLGPQTETFPSYDALADLVRVEVETLGTNCESFVAALLPPNKPFPMALAPNKKLKLSYQAFFSCANDPLATSKTESHNDFETVATVDLSALGEQDTVTSNDTCPRSPNAATADKGCGNKDKTTKQLGAPVFTDVVVKE